MAALNELPGVTTRASCQGASPSATNGHAELAYVLFEYPPPLRLDEYLCARLGTVARCEDAGIYSRRRLLNARFADALCRAANEFPRDTGCRQAVRWPLARLRAHMARCAEQSSEAVLTFCRTCRELHLQPGCTYPQLPLVSLPPRQDLAWFAQFASERPNDFDPALVAATGWASLLQRAHAGDLGLSFHRRWLRYRAARIAALATSEIRAGVRRIRAAGNDVDFFYDRSTAELSWAPAAAATPSP